MTNTMIYFKYLFAFLFSDKFNLFIHFLNTSEHHPTWRSVCLFCTRHLDTTLWFVMNDFIGPSLRPSHKLSNAIFYYAFVVASLYLFKMFPLDSFTTSSN